MSEAFFSNPILNSPYHYPDRHWELDESGQPTQKTINSRRKASFITPVPKPQKYKAKGATPELTFNEAEQVSTATQRYETLPTVNEVRGHVERWRALPRGSWNVTAETAQLLDHWRNHKFHGIRPFFCQIEAVETAIWLTEVAPYTTEGKEILARLEAAKADANPGLNRLALKLATGAGKTTVMAMLIAWQTINAVRHPNSKKFSKGFLIVTPGITIKDRLRVLQPNDPNSYFKTMELVPQHLLANAKRAVVVITNYHAFKLKETLELSAGGRALLQGRGEALNTKESEGQMLQRVVNSLLGMKQVIVLNDEAHHCYREKPAVESEEESLDADEKAEAKENAEAARLWISGLEALTRKLSVPRIFDLSATPFFLRGSGYAEGTLFPWTMSDFSLMDAIECGIVKLPRVPIADNKPDAAADAPMFRKIWEHIRKKMPKAGRSKAGTLDPSMLPAALQNAIDALYTNYEKVHQVWQEHHISVPPCFIFVCNNTSTSKLVYDYISGYQQPQAEGPPRHVPGHCELFRNYDTEGNPLPQMNTILVDSKQLEAGDNLSPDFRKIAADEIDRFRREMAVRNHSGRVWDGSISDQDLLREVMNTVGKEGKLGGQIRCVVSVSMLTEGWDANNVTHILGVRAFGTQLLCEQVVGRALRRRSYHLNEEEKFDVEYADVLGIPFDFNAKPVVPKPPTAKDSVNVHAVSPEQDACEIIFPRVQSYRTELSRDTINANFTQDSRIVLTPEEIGPTNTLNAGIIGESIELTPGNLGSVRDNTVIFTLTKYLIERDFKEEGKEPPLHLFGQFKNVVREWVQDHLICRGGVHRAQILYYDWANRACERIAKAITRGNEGQEAVKAIIDPFTPTGSTRFVNFNTSVQNRWKPDPRKCHLNWLVMDSSWESEFCRVLEAHPKVLAYVKNHGLGFEVPYNIGNEPHRYLPDFIVRLDDGHGPEDPLNVIVEVKGRHSEEVKDKNDTITAFWVPGVNHHQTYGRWDFRIFYDPFDMTANLKSEVTNEVERILQDAIEHRPLNERA